MSAPTPYGALLLAGERLAAGHRYYAQVGTARAFGGEPWREHLASRDMEPEDEPLALTASLYVFFFRNLADRSLGSAQSALAFAATAASRLGVDAGAVLVYDPGSEQTLGQRVIDRAVAPLEQGAHQIVGAAEAGIEHVVGAAQGALDEARRQAHELGGALGIFGRLADDAAQVSANLRWFGIAGVAAVALVAAIYYWPRRDGK